MTGFSRSYTHGVSTTPLLYQTIGEVLDLAAQRWPDQEAVVVRDRNIRLWTWNFARRLTASPPASSRWA